MSPSLLCYYCYMYCCSVTQSCPTLCDPMDCSTPVLTVLHHLHEFAQNHVHWVGDAIQPSDPLSPSLPIYSLFKQSFPALGSLPVSWLFSSSGQSIGASASASVLPMNIQGWFSLGLTNLISMTPSQESFPTPQFKNINSSPLSLLYGPTLTSIYDYWKIRSFD